MSQLVLVDTSVWVQIFGPKTKYKLDYENIKRVATCPPIIQEILQGIKQDQHFTRVYDGLLALPRFGSPTEMDDYLLAADIYRTGRSKGYAIRSSADCLIAAIAIQNQLPVMHDDRDFSAIAKFTKLKTTPNF
jgi:predicted nucleic acid-binding protein